MNSRSVVAAVGAAVIVALLTACTPEPQPAPTPTPTSTAFASEADAFAAAEETYRAYVDALNQVDLSDPATFEAVYAWTTGEANAASRQSFSQMHAEGLTVGGVSTPTVVEARSSEDAPDGVEVAVCVDVSQVTLVNPSNESVVAPDRRDVQSLLLDLEVGETPTGWSISLISGREGEPACS
ncbi:hypothetical protein NQ166_09755 [Microbacterium sp. zg.Y1090]|uniref:hypothetical protein n=1 Tax=Microbacterium wangruii TaxID=3049073 RepID=UPI00214D75F5|nr:MULTISPECIES: hypothetical protein [unclassified Microbacterium]MCR2819110.1 hypothetical protein [Microbacterium sp. zg.Y1090]WIM27413.1 hypothetical protein QNO26_09570 [Microbacterium sp. zg-Y1090]